MVIKVIKDNNTSSIVHVRNSCILKEELNCDLVSHESEIENALKDPTALRELSAKLSKGEQQLATAQKSQLDPIKQTEQPLREYNDFLMDQEEMGNFEHSYDELVYFRNVVMNKRPAWMNNR